MNVSEAIRLRKSVRGFKPQPVPQEVLRQILETAIHSPSAMNTQPWEISVVSGKVLDDLKQANSALLASGAKPNDEKIRYQGVFRQRQVDLAIQLFKLMGIAREDKVKRAQWNEISFLQRAGSDYYFSGSISRTDASPL
jgi:nitroreductase